MNAFAAPSLKPRLLDPTLAGKILLPSDDGFDEARRAWNLAVDQRPAAVVFPESAAEVAAAIRYAADRGLRVAAQSTGHNAGPLGALDGTVLLRTGRMRGIQINPRTRTARVEAGVVWLDVVHAAAAHGLAALAGSSPDVGVAGYTLGGGLSFLGRKFGLAASNVTAIELVTADGQMVRADHEHEPDLFWALRGGGGSFGVVTAIEFRLFPLTHAYAGVLWYPIERGAEVRACLTSGLDAAVLGDFAPDLRRSTILRSILDARRPLRCHNPSGDATILELPAAHPDVFSYLVVPIASPARVYGWLGLGNKVGADEFSDADEQVAGLLGVQAAVAYENALRFQALRETEERTEFALRAAQNSRGAANRVGDI
jgi:hypothetical protein